jgi:uncharacterized membrane protein
MMDIRGTIGDLLQLNDWKFKHFLLVVFISQVLVAGLAALAAIGIQVPVFTQIIGFIYLALLPGFILLRALSMHRIGPARTLLYAVGASLIFNMLLGFLINIIMPLCGINRPFSILPLFITWFVMIGILTLTAFLRDRHYYAFESWNFSEIVWPVVLFSVLLPLLAVLGAETVNYMDTNIVLMGLIVLITVVAIVMMMGKLIPFSYFPLVIFCISLALLWQDSLVSNHLTGYDIFSEFYFSNQVLLNGVWDLSIPHAYNAMLSVAVLPATYSIFLNMSLEYVFKIIYPVLYAAMPLALYTMFSKQIGRRQAFQAVFFVVSIYTFFLIMPSLARQMVGQLFFVLLIMLLLDEQSSVQKKLLFILFGVGLIVSHYSLSYIFMAFLIISLIISSALRKKVFQMTFFSVVLFCVICFAWYIFVSSSSPLISIVDVGRRIVENVTASFFDLFSRDAVPYLTSTSPDAIHFINRIVHYLLLFFTIIGANRLLPGRSSSFSPPYIGFALGSYIFLFASIVVPYLSGSLGIERVFHLSIVILAPLTVLGANDIFDFLRRIIRKISYRGYSPGTITLGILLGLFFLFNSEFVWVMIQDPLVQSLPLNYNALAHDSRNIQIDRKISMRAICPSDQEVLAGYWLADNMDKKMPVFALYCDLRVPALSTYGRIPEEKTGMISLSDPNAGIQHGYIYLGYVNVVYRFGTTFLGSDRGLEFWNIDELRPYLDKYPRLYDNGAAEVYFYPE